MAIEQKLPIEEPKQQNMRPKTDDAFYSNLGGLLGKSFGGLKSYLDYRVACPICPMTFGKFRSGPSRPGGARDEV